MVTRDFNIFTKVNKARVATVQSRNTLRENVFHWEKWKNIFSLSLVGTDGPQAAVLVAILMEKGGRRRQAWWGQRDAANNRGGRR